MNLIIVADRGGLKAFKTSKERDEKGIELLEEFFIEDDRGPYKEKVTDQAGSFRHWGATGEKKTIDLENEHRAVRKVAKDLIEVLKKYQPASWNFAAPSEINHAVLENVDHEIGKNLRHNLKKDLMNIPPRDLVGHFEHA